MDLGTWEPAFSLQDGTHSHLDTGTTYHRWALQGQGGGAYGQRRGQRTYRTGTALICGAGEEHQH